MRLTRTFRQPKVPVIDGPFWYVKLLSTAMGEATSDYFVHHESPQLVVLVGAAVFAVALYNQLIAPRYLVGSYWFAVTMVSVFGTMVADVVHVALGVPYQVSAAGFALCVAALFAAWWKVEGTLDIHSITTRRRELFYWAAVTATFALGTAVGDLSAYVVGLGFARSALVFGVLFALPGLYALTVSRHSVGAFWSAYVLTRPFGASVADWLGVAHARGGLDWGPGNVALIFSTLILLGVAEIARRERRRRPVG